MAAAAAATAVGGPGAALCLEGWTRESLLVLRRRCRQSEAFVLHKPCLWRAQRASRKPRHCTVAAAGTSSSSSSTSSSSSSTQSSASFQPSASSNQKHVTSTSPPEADPPPPSYWKKPGQLAVWVGLWAVVLWSVAWLLRRMQAEREALRNSPPTQPSLTQEEEQRVESVVNVGEGELSSTQDTRTVVESEEGRDQEEGPQGAPSLPSSLSPLPSASPSSIVKAEREGELQLEAIADLKRSTEALRMRAQEKVKDKEEEEEEEEDDKEKEERIASSEQAESSSSSSSLPLSGEKSRPEPKADPEWEAYLQRQVDEAMRQKADMQFRKYERENPDWWLDLKFVCVIFISGAGGYYSLDMSATGERKPHVIAFEDRNDAEAFKWLLRRHELKELAETAGMKVTVIQKGRFDLKHDQSFEEIQNQLIEIGGLEYWTEYLRSASK
eukprot:jgi/Chlat1/5037/Chrsp329S00829